MLIDCDRCTARGVACGGCPMTVLFDLPAAGHHRLDEPEIMAIEVLTRAGFDVTVLEPTHETSRSRQPRRGGRRWHAA